MRALLRIGVRSAVLEWRYITSSTIEKILLFALPALVIAVLWSAFSQAQIQNLPIGVLNQDNSSLSRKLLRMIDATPGVAVQQYYANANEMQEALEAVDEFAVLVIPHGFAHKIQRLETSPVTLNVNAQYGTHSGIIQYAVSTAVRTFSAGVAIQSVQSQLKDKNAATVAVMPIQVQAQQAFHQAVNYQRILANNIIPSLLHILAAVVGVGAIGRELRNKTLGHWFRGVCGKQTGQHVEFFAVMAAVIGKLWWQFLIFSCWMVVALLLIAEQNNAALGSLFITIVVACLMIAISLLLGVLLTTLTMSKRIGLSLTGMITAPAFSYSGLTYPVVAMPVGAQYVSVALPLTHYLHVQAEQLQSTVNWRASLDTTYVFILVVVIMLVLATKLTQAAAKKRHAWGKR